MVDDHLLELLLRHALAGCEEARPHVDEVGACGDCAGHSRAVADPAADRHDAVEEVAHGRAEGKGGQMSCVPTGASGDTGQSVDARRDGLAREGEVDDVGDDEAAVRLDHLHDR